MGEQFGTPYTVAGPGRAPRTGTAGDTWYRRTEPRPSSSAGARFTQEEGGKKRRETARPLRITPQDQPARERIRPTAQRGQPQDLPVSGPALRSPPSTGLSFFFIIFRVRRPAVSFILFIFLLFFVSGARPSAFSFVLHNPSPGRGGGDCRLLCSLSLRGSFSRPRPKRSAGAAPR